VKPAVGTEEPARVGMPLEEGATITTGLDGKVTLDWFGEGETRLGASSELIVRTARSAEEDPLVIRLRLESGRAWTRVMRLLEIDADLSVETNDVVATVRGTSFDVETAPGMATTIWVADSVVEAAGATVAGPADGFFIPEGSMAEFDSGRLATTTRPLSDADRETEWFRSNREADERFRSAVLPHMKTALAAERIPAEGFRRTLGEWSERMRVRFASGQRRERLSGRYFLRHLMAIRRAAEEGKSGLAYREFARMDGEMKTRLETEDSKREMRMMMQAAQRMFQDVQPASPAYRIKQQVEEWSMHTAHEPADRLHARLVTISSRLDEAARALDEEQPEAASQVLVLARQGLENVDRER
ncbi:MAG: FecR family protein, partial [Candidatus Uhrbacteria bacterium]|nr:FecR family protein [Candidatus Uhrbacteria bacterium]